MKHTEKLLLFVAIAILASCAGVKPKNFTCHFQNQYTGIDTLIDIQGCYVSQRACDTNFYSVFMFYSNGLFTIATGDDLTGLIDCFENGGNSSLCRYPLWGAYCINGDKICTQTILEEGIGVCVIFRDYLIAPDKKLININDFVVPEHTNLGNMKNYPSFAANPCPKEIPFYPLKTKRDSTECPLLKRTYFSGE